MSSVGLVGADGFDHYSSFGQLLLLGQSNLSWVSAYSGSLGTGRFQGQCVNPGDDGIYASLFESFPTIYTHQAIHTASGSPGAYFTLIYSDSGTTQVSLVFSLNNCSVSAYRGSTLLGSSANNVFTIGTWFDLETKITIDPSAGVVQVKINSATVLVLTGQNTRVTSNSSLNGFAFVDGNFSLAVDDLVIRDDAWIGLVYLPTQFATANSTVSWTPSTGTNYTNINALTQSVNYNSTSTVGASDTFAFGTLTNATSVNGVVVFTEFWKDSAGTCSVSSEVIGDSATAYGATQPANSTPGIVMDCFALDPAGNAWTQTIFNTARFGYKRQA